VNALVTQAGQFLLHAVVNNNMAFSIRSTTWDYNEILMDTVYIDKTV
jgi:hypothetical protein